MSPCAFAAQMVEEAKLRGNQDNTQTTEVEDEFECEVCDEVNVIHKLKEESAECQACGMLNEEALEIIKSNKEAKMNVKVKDDEFLCLTCCHVNTFSVDDLKTCCCSECE